jgi:hypothetical protein
MLTNETNRAIRDNVVTDANANVADPRTHAEVRLLSPDAALLLNKSLVAKPLMVPELCSLHIKNTEYRYRWVNSQGKNGYMYTLRRSQGFTNATTDDAVVLGGDAVATNGEIRSGDVILMKLRQDIYDAAIKYNIEKALVLQRSRGMYLKDASSDVFSDAVAKRESITNAVPVAAGAFIPDNPDALISGSSQAAARANIESIRENARKHPEKTISGHPVNEV